ncbi:ABC transporter permease [Tenggerimyces flavus]|uniref:ABC transporter permease n=1 Tax=Tenggerimyces flavus TaxID=1708749 RepID=A0ABV7YIL1_9ACTN|nr:ABC transporter permease [Tenggerimyces flavus]MBM7789275.1 ABC-2 type transport system permease protein [Tenggerimyces flavus]
MSVEQSLPRQPSGVIHDIGYRRYEGQRLGRGYAVRSLFVQSLRNAFGLGRTAKSKVLPIALLGVILLPAVVIDAVTILQGTGEQLIPYTRYIIFTQVIIAIFVAAQAPALFSRDLRFRTVSLYFSRPLTRLDYVVAKFGALTTALLILMTLPLLVLYGGGLLAKLPFGTQTKNFLLAFAGALIFSLILAGVGSVLASLTKRRGFGVAAIIAALTVPYAAVTAIQGIAQELSDTPGLASWAGLFSPTTLLDGVQVALLGADSSSPIPPPAGFAGGAVFVLVALVVIAGSFGLLLVRYRKVAAE